MSSTGSRCAPERSPLHSRACSSEVIGVARAGPGSGFAAAAPGVAVASTTRRARPGSRTILRMDMILLPRFASPPFYATIGVASSPGFAILRWPVFASRASELDQPEPVPLGHGPGARGLPELGPDVGDVPMHGVRAEHEPLRDLPVAQPRRDHAEH